MTNKPVAEEKSAFLYEFKRNNYYNGKLLATQDFQIEQQYINDKRHLINSMVLGTGVICGLQVTSVQQENGEKTDKQQVGNRTQYKLAIAPGAAIDGQGRELIVPTTQYKDVPADLMNVPVGGTKTALLCLYYDEQSSEPMPTITAGSNGNSGAGKYNYTIEKIDIQFLDDEKAKKTTRSAQELASKTVSVFSNPKNTWNVTRTTPIWSNPGEIVAVTLELSSTEAAVGPIEIYEELKGCKDTAGEQEVLVRFENGHSTRHTYFVRTPEAAGEATIHTKQVRAGDTTTQVDPVDPSNVTRIEVIAESVSSKIVAAYFKEHPHHDEKPCVAIAALRVSRNGADVTLTVEPVPRREYVYNNRLLYELISYAEKRVGPIGPTGARGPGITAVSVETLAPDFPAEARLEVIPADPENDAQLHLGLPQGQPGRRGPGIADVTTTMVASGSQAEARLVPIPGNPDNDMRLHLSIPRGDPGTRPAQHVFNRVINASWHHDEVLTAADFVERFPNGELVVAFQMPVRIDTLHKRSVSAFMHREEAIDALDLPLACECALPITVVALARSQTKTVSVRRLIGDVESPQSPFDLIDVTTSTQKADDNEGALAVQLQLPPQLADPAKLSAYIAPLPNKRLTLKIVLRGDWIMDEPEFLQLPSSFKAMLSRAAITDDLIHYVRENTQLELAAGSQIVLEEKGRRWRIVDQANRQEFIVKHFNNRYSLRQRRALDGNHIWPGVPGRPSGNGMAGGDWVSLLHIQS